MSDIDGTLFGLMILIAIVWFIGRTIKTHQPVVNGPPAQPVVNGPPTLPLSVNMVCPHCQMKGSVSTRSVKLKKGISGGKAVGAVLTAGFSVLAVGLSRKESSTEASCSNCGAVWHF